LKTKKATYKAHGEYIRRFKMISFLKNESGATAAEYGIIAGTMGLIIIMSWTPTYASISSVMGHLIQNLTG